MAGSNPYLQKSEQTFTTSSIRYYADELEGYDLLMETFERYNRMTEWFYNLSYENEFCNKPFTDKTTRLIKNHYREVYGGRLTDYYVTSIQSHVSGMIRSQKELLKFYKQQNDIAVERCSDKQAKVKESLDIHMEIKKYIAAYCRSETRGTAAPDNTVPDKYKFYITKDRSSKTIHFYDKKLHLNLYLYECSLDEKIRREKNRIAFIGERIKRLEAKQFDVPSRMTFGGGRKFYKKKDTLELTGHALRQWHDERAFNRNRHINFSGRHTSKHGNFQCRYNLFANGVEITLMDGSVIALKDICFPYRGKELVSYLHLRMGSVGYSLERKKDGSGREYLILKAALTVKKDHVNDTLVDGCISFDTNADNFSWSELDGNGRRLDAGIIPFCLDGLSSAERKRTLAVAINQMVNIAAARKKPVVMEDLEFFRKKAGMRYQDKSYNRMLSAFAYSQITELTKGSCFKADVGLFIVPPAYTSLIAKLKYMRPLGCSIHSAASFVIGRRAMGKTEEIPGYLRTVMEGKCHNGGFWKQWKPVQSHTPPVSWRKFHHKIPVLKNWNEFAAAF